MNTDTERSCRRLTAPVFKLNLVTPPAVFVSLLIVASVVWSTGRRPEVVPSDS